MKRRWHAITAAVLLVLGALAPILANDVPLVASADGRLTWPAFADWFGSPPEAPDARGWKHWLAALPDDSPDWGLMPPWPHGSIETDRSLRNHKPSLRHPLGNDDNGRDVLARLLHGTGTAVLVGAAVALLSLLIGLPLGALAGWCGGAVDFAVMRLVEVFLCFPSLLLALCGAAWCGSSMVGVVAVLVAVSWTSFARIVRAEVSALRDREFVQTARGLGVHPLRILMRHVLPQLWRPVGIAAAFVVAQAIVVESTLSFLGLGPGGSSWGSVLAQGKDFAHLGAWHLWLFPTLLIWLCVACCHAFTERRDAHQPAPPA